MTSITPVLSCTVRLRVPSPSTAPERVPMTRGMRFRPLTALLLFALFAVAGCMPSDGSPGSPGVPVIGQSRLSAADLVAFYRSHAPSSLPYRAQGATLEELAQLYVDEGNRYAGIPAYAAHFDRMGVKPIETAISGPTPDDIRAGLTKWKGAVDEVVLRAITANDTLEETLTLVRAAKPA